MLVPESDGVDRGLPCPQRQVYVVDLLGGPSRMRDFHLTGGTVEAPWEMEVPCQVPAIEDIGAHRRR